MRMKRFLLVIPAWICLIVSTQSLAQTITFERHMPHNSDSLLAYKLPFIAVTDSGRNCIWDFSSLPMDSAEIIEINHYAPAADTITVGLHRERAHYYYHCVHDTLWMTGFENDHTHVRYSAPSPWLKYPFVYGDSLCGSYSGNGQYCHILPVRTEGTCSIYADAVGKLILPDMEIDSVLRVHASMRYYESTHLRNLITEDRYDWYSPSCRYPLLETVSLKTIQDKDTVAFTSSYYIPQEQIDDFLEQEEKDSLIENVEKLITDISFMPNPVYRDLRINYSLIRSAQVYISVHYNGGVTTFQTPVRFEEEGAHSVFVNMSGMPIGSYVVYIHADDTVASGSVIKL